MGCGSSSTDGAENKKESKKDDSNNNSEKQKLYMRGNQLLKQKKFQLANKLYDRVIAIDPDFMDAYYSKGVVALELEQIEEANKLFQQVLEKQPDHVFAINEIGSLKIREKQFEEALAYFEKAFTIREDFSEVNYGLGYSLSKLSRKEEAIKYYDLAIKADDKQKQFYVNKSATLTELKRYEEAMVCIDQALKLDPEYIEALIAKGFIFKSSKQFKELLDISQQILKLDAENKIGQIYFKLSEKEQSTVQQEQKVDPQTSTRIDSMSIGDDIESLIEAVQKLRAEKRLSLSLQMVNQILNKDPINVKGLQLKALILIDLKQYQNALDYCELFLANMPKDIQMLKEKAQILEHLNRLDDALKCHYQIIDEEANFAKSEKRANLLIKLGKAQEASEIFENLSQQQRNQNDPQIYLIRGKLFVAQNKIDESLVCLQEAAEKFPKNIEILMFLGKQQQSKELFKEAIQTFSQILDIDKHNEACLYQRGFSYYKLKQYSQALENFLKIKNPNFNDEIYFYVGDCYYQTKDYKESIKYLLGYLQFGKQSLEQCHFLLGEIYYHEVRFDEACESYQNCLKQNINNAKAHFQLAQVYKSDKQLDEAKIHYEKAFELEPKNEEYKKQHEIINAQESLFSEYRNSLLFTLVTFIGCCQLNQKSSDFDKNLNDKYIGLLLLLEQNLKKRFNSIENHFEKLKELISRSYDMKLTVIDDTLFPIMQFWYNQQICKKKKTDFDFVSIMINAVKLIITENSDQIYNLISSDKTLKNKYCLEFAEKCQHEAYQKRSGNLGLIDGIKILGFLLKYQKDFIQNTQNFSEFISQKYERDEIQIFHDSYYQLGG